MRFRNNHDCIVVTDTADAQVFSPEGTAGSSHGREPVDSRRANFKAPKGRQELQAANCNPFGTGHTLMIRVHLASAQ